MLLAAVDVVRGPRGQAGPCASRAIALQLAGRLGDRGAAAIDFRGASDALGEIDLQCQPALSGSAGVWLPAKPQRGARSFWRPFFQARRRGINEDAPGKN